MAPGPGHWPSTHPSGRAAPGPGTGLQRFHSGPGRNPALGWKILAYQANPFIQQLMSTFWMQRHQGDPKAQPHSSEANTKHSLGRTVSLTKDPVGRGGRRAGVCSRAGAWGRVTTGLPASLPGAPRGNLGQAIQGAPAPEGAGGPCQGHRGRQERKVVWAVGWRTLGTPDCPAVAREGPAPTVLHDGVRNEVRRPQHAQRGPWGIAGTSMLKPQALGLWPGLAEAS